jgi:agmatine/peptidylarginine deiminase
LLLWFLRQQPTHVLIDLSYTLLACAAKALRSFKVQYNSALTVLLPCLTCTALIPQADHYDKGYTPRIPGERLSASYINHYKANGGAVLSRFGAGAAMADQRALDILGEAYCK